MLETVWEGLHNALLMAWQVWWALVLGFAISAAVQAWAPRGRVQSSLGGGGVRAVALATGLGAASSSCSYAAIAIARSLFAMGASAASALAFQFASTNLVVELGIVLWVLIGWQFTLAELLGGIVLVAVMTLLLRLFVSRRLETRARAHAEQAAGQSGGHCHAHAHRHAHDSPESAGHPASDEPPDDSPAERPDGKATELPDDTSPESPYDTSSPPPADLAAKLRSARAWADVARDFRSDWAMLYREIAIGMLLAGFVGLLGQDAFNGLFVVHAPEPWRLLENVLVGPIVAIASSVCSVGNIPLAAVLWSGGIGFGGVIAFVFADLLVLPIVLAYRRYYGSAYTLRICMLMFVTIVIAALIVDGLFSAAGLIPSVRPTRAQVFGEVSLDYTFVLNVLASFGFVALLALSTRGHRPDADRAAQHPHHQVI